MTLPEIYSNSYAMENSALVNQKLRYPGVPSAFDMDYFSQHELFRNHSMNSLACSDKYAQYADRLQPPRFGAMDNLASSQCNDRQVFLPKFPPQNFEIPDIQEGKNAFADKDNGFLARTFRQNSSAMRPAAHDFKRLMGTSAANAFQYPLTRAVAPSTLSSAGSTDSSPSSHMEDGGAVDTCNIIQQSLKRAAMQSVDATQVKKVKPPKKRRKRDPNEPQKPVSAYSLFFRNVQAAIKNQKPNATFGDISKIVASMWDGLDDEQKSVYKRQMEAAKKEYLKQLAVYKASLVSKQQQQQQDDRLTDTDNLQYHTSVMQTTSVAMPLDISTGQPAASPLLQRSSGSPRHGFPSPIHRHHPVSGDNYMLPVLRPSDPLTYFPDGRPFHPGLAMAAGHHRPPENSNNYQVFPQFTDNYSYGGYQNHVWQQQKPFPVDLS